MTSYQYLPSGVYIYIFFFICVPNKLTIIVIYLISVSSDLQTYMDAMVELAESAMEINNSASDFFAINVNNITYTIDPNTLVSAGKISCLNGSVANDGACG